MDNSMPVRGLVIRYGEHVCPSGDTISEHAQVLGAHGKFLFGKFGGTVAKSRLDQLRAQVSAGTPTFVYLTKREGGRSRIHRAHLVGIPEALTASQKPLIPAYYRDDSSRVSVWLCCDSLEADEEAIRHLLVESSHSPLAEALGASMSPKFNAIWSKEPVAGAGQIATRRRSKAAQPSGEVPTIEPDDFGGPWNDGLDDYE